MKKNYSSKPQKPLESSSNQSPASPSVIQDGFMLGLDSTKGLQLCLAQNDKQKFLPLL